MLPCGRLMYVVAVVMSLWWLSACGAENDDGNKEGVNARTNENADPGAPQAGRGTRDIAALPLTQPAPFPAGHVGAFRFNHPVGRPAAVGVTFSDVDFQGASILVRVNGRQMLPYHVFGGDTRYEHVKGNAELNPPLAKIQANFVLPPAWLKADANTLEIENTGPGQATITAITVQPASAHELPQYENPIYFDFDVWRQGVLMRPGIDWFHDTMLLGVIPGGGTTVMNYSGGDGLALKQAAERARIDWGFVRATFYSIWHLANAADQWAEFIDLDDNAETSGRIHSQFANPPTVPAGTDIALIGDDGYLNMLKPGIDALAAWSTDYNLSCEQWGPRGQGFGAWWGDDHADKGYDAVRWANNYQTQFGRVVEHIRAVNPTANVTAPHWWMPDIRFLLYDTSLARGHKMRDMTDTMMTHYSSMPFGGYDADGKLVMDDDAGIVPRIDPKLQYPGGTFEEPDWEMSRPYMGSWVLIPEIAIDWNRYRLSRTEKDMSLGDPKVNRWPNGSAFNYEAGFDGDEGSYNNETCVYDRNYNGPATYQFLYAMFTYSLLPTAATEPQELKITRTLPLRPKGEPTHDIFSEVDQPINLYGSWVEGAAHTHRLRTQDPLYGDMFGYTGFEYATTGDYIWLCGIKERHHRREPHNAWNLVRRTCYAFVTAAPVYPAQVNDADTNHLFVKTLLIKQDGRDVIGVYAVNFDQREHKLDITLPVGWERPTSVQVFDHNAADWSDAQEGALSATAGELRVTASLPAGSPWCMFIYPPAGEAARVLTQLNTPQPRTPWGETHIDGPAVNLIWRASGADDEAAAARYHVQVAREMLFRPEDIVAQNDDVRETQWVVSRGLTPGARFHWRVRAIDGQGNSTLWTRPQTFWYDGADRVMIQQEDAPVAETLVPRATPLADLSPFTDRDNLAHTGMPFSWPNYWEGAHEAVDGFADSVWLPDDSQRQPQFPAWWAVRFDQPQTVRRVALLWADQAKARDYDIQIWDGQTWQTVKSVTGNNQARNEMQIDIPDKTRAVRIWITAPVVTTTHLAEVYIR